MSDPILLPLAADCSIRTIKPLQTELIAALARADIVALDCAMVERTDVSFVQLILAASRTAAQQGKQVGLANAPAPVEAAFTRAGAAMPRVPLH